MGVVRLEDKGHGVALITFDKPGRMNAWSQDLSEEFWEAMNACNDDVSVRVVVVTGAGRAFCAGADAQGRFDAKKPTDEEKAKRRERLKQMKGWKVKRFHDIAQMRMPVIAAINGGCVGIGFSLALACDLRFAAKDAKIGVIFPKRGLVAEDGMGYYLPHLLGTGNALMMLLTGDVHLAEDLPPGLVQRTFPKEELLPATLAFAQALAINSSPTAVSVIKRQAYLLPHKSLAEAQRINDVIQASSLAEANPDHQEGFAAFTGKRAPSFKPYDADLPYARTARELLQFDQPARL